MIGIQGVLHLAMRTFFRRLWLDSKPFECVRDSIGMLIDIRQIVQTFPFVVRWKGMPIRSSHQIPIVARVDSCSY